MPEMLFDHRFCLSNRRTEDNCKHVVRHIVSPYACMQSLERKFFKIFRITVNPVTNRILLIDKLSKMPIRLIFERVLPSLQIFRKYRRTFSEPSRIFHCGLCYHVRKYAEEFLHMLAIHEHVGAVERACVIRLDLYASARTTIVFAQRNFYLPSRIIFGFVAHYVLTTMKKSVRIGRIKNRSGFHAYSRKMRTAIAQRIEPEAIFETIGFHFFHIVQPL